jgi:Carboxypeptidase regulatory-like domain
MGVFQMPNLKCVSRLVSLPLLLSACVFSQTDTGSLSGIVTDPSAGAISSAAVHLKNRGTGAVRSSLSAADGRYQFNLLAPGLYELSVEASGFKKFLDDGVRLQVAQEPH